MIRPSILTIVITIALMEGSSSWLSAWNSPTLQEPVAVITQIDGEVFLQRGQRKAKALKSTAFLYVGDSVQAGTGSAVVYQVYAPVFRLTPRKSKKIESLSSPSTDGAVTPEDFAWYRKHYASALRNQNNPSRHTQGGPDEEILLLISPRHSITFDERPIFEWTPIKDATNYEVQVYDMKSTPIWKVETGDTHVKYPDDIKALSPGDYKLDVSTRANNRRFYDATQFTVATSDAVDKMKSALARAKRIGLEAESNNLIYVAALIEFHQFPLAEKELKYALKRTPEDGSLWALLMQVYQEMKLWEYREEARSLKANPNQPTALKQFLEH